MSIKEFIIATLKSTVLIAVFYSIVFGYFSWVMSNVKFFTFTPQPHITLALLISPVLIIALLIGIYWFAKRYLHLRLRILTLWLLLALVCMILYIHTKTVLSYWESYQKGYFHFKEDKYKCGSKTCYEENDKDFLNFYLVFLSEEFTKILK